MSTMVCRFIAVILLCCYVLPLLGAPFPSETNSTTTDVSVELQIALQISYKTKVCVNNTLKYYCSSVIYPSAYKCEDFIKHIIRSMDSTFPILHIRDNLNFSTYNHLEIALVNITSVLSQYSRIMKCQLTREYSNLCSPAEELGVPCHYPDACSSKHLKDDAIFFCYLQQASSFLNDLKLLLKLPITTYTQEVINIDNDLLVPLEAPLTLNRWFSMVTLYHLQGLIDQVNSKLQLV